MTNKEREYLENLEGCFDQVKSACSDAKDEIDRLNTYIEILKNLCRAHSIEIPDIEEPPFF